MRQYLLFLIIYFIYWTFVTGILLCICQHSHADPVRIALVDTGYDANIVPESDRLKLCNTGHYDYNADKPSVGFIGDHGTQVATILARELKGVDYCAIILQVSEPGYIMPDVSALRAYEHLDKIQVDAVNLSFQDPQHIHYEQQLLARLSAKNIMMFVAAGNGRVNFDDECSVFPACYDLPNLFAVGAFDETAAMPAAYSNRGKKVKLWFSGISAFNKTMSYGTSFAAPRALAEYAKKLAKKRLTEKNLRRPKTP